MKISKCARVAAAGAETTKEDVMSGVKAGDKEFKVRLDGYNNSLL